MIRLDQPDRCAFCGQLIGADEPKSGRGESAAHVACADAALADDRFWDRIAAGLGDTAPAEAGRSGETGDSGAGAKDGVGSEGGEKPRPASGGRSGAGCALPALLALSAALTVLLLSQG